jgi:ATP/maltotriose-dependent transcriptional regulator MalT
VGRLAARTGRFAEAHVQFTAAQREYSAVGLGADARAVDGWVAECLVLEGRAGDALGLLDAMAREVGTGAPDSDDRALLERVRAQALVQRGELDAARDALAASLEAGRGRGADYEVALTELVSSHLAALVGDSTAAGQLEGEARATLARLGVHTVPTPAAAARADPRSRPAAR